MRSLRLAIVGVSAVLAAAGCGAGASSGGDPSSAASIVGPGASGHHPLTPEQVTALLAAGAREVPPRPADEYVPTSVDRALLTSSVDPTDDTSPTGSALPKPVTVTGPVAQQLIADLDNLRTRPDSTTSCQMALRKQSATFTYDGHTLVATLGICGGVAVTLDNQRLPMLVPTDAFTRDITDGMGAQRITGAPMLHGNK